MHQNTQIGSVDITDTWEPLEEGLNRLETTRHVSVITITLSTVPLDPTTVGYQAPIEDELVKPLQDSSVAGRPRNPGRCSTLSHAAPFQSCFAVQRRHACICPPLRQAKWSYI